MLDLFIKPYVHPIYGSEHYAVFDKKKYDGLDEYEKDSALPLAVFFSEQDAQAYVNAVNGSERNFKRIEYIQQLEKIEQKKELERIDFYRNGWRSDYMKNKQNKGKMPR